MLPKPWNLPNTRWREWDKPPYYDPRTRLHEPLGYWEIIPRFPYFKDSPIYSEPRVLPDFMPPSLVTRGPVTPMPRVEPPKEVTPYIMRGEPMTSFYPSEQYFPSRDGFKSGQWAPTYSYILGSPIPPPSPQVQRILDLSYQPSLLERAWEEYYRLKESRGGKRAPRRRPKGRMSELNKPPTHLLPPGGPPW